MAIDEKIRSLYCGLPAGLNFVSTGDTRILPLKHIPFELQLIVARWIDAIPQTDDETEETPIMSNNSEHGLALTEEGWGAFVTWMLETLHNEQTRQAAKSIV